MTEQLPTKEQLLNDPIREKFVFLTSEKHPDQTCIGLTKETDFWGVVYKYGRVTLPDETKINSEIIEFTFAEKNSDKLKIYFDKNSLEFKGWKTKDTYSNNVNFVISNLKTNNVIKDEFFKIPREDDL